MVSPNATGGDDEEEDNDGLENPWKEDDDGDEEEDDVEGIDGETEIATADVHEENVRVDDVGDINDSSSSDLSEAEIEDGDDSDEEEEVEVATADVTEDDVDGGEKFGFAGEEDAEGTGEDDGNDEEDTDVGGSEEPDEGGIADDINNGVASLGVVGIEDEETQDELREDFRRTARDFRLGYYGQDCVEEFFLSDGADDVSPVWGLVFASMVCAAIFAFKRPDTEELGGKVNDAIGNIGDGIGGASS